MWYNPSMVIHKYTCQNCGRKIERNIKPYRLKKYPPKFCNRKCFHLELKKTQKSNKRELKCNYCNTAFLRHLSDIKKTFNFCSRECKDRAQSIYSGDKFASMRPKHYANGKRAYRNKAFDFYGKQCQRCGYNRCPSALQVHHIDRDRKNNTTKNLEVVCRNCHAEEHYGNHVTEREISVTH